MIQFLKSYLFVAYSSLAALKFPNMTIILFYDFYIVCRLMSVLWELKWRYAGESPILMPSPPESTVVGYKCF